MKRLVPIAIALALTISLISIAVAQKPRLANVHLSDTPDGPAMTQFPSGTTVVYAIFDYVDMVEEPIKVRVYDNYGSILFEQTKTYSGSGTESIATTTTEGYFPDGRYVTNFYRGEYVSRTIIWEVGEPVAPTPETPRRAKGFPWEWRGLVPVLSAIAIVLIVFVAWAIRRVLAAR